MRPGKSSWGSLTGAVFSRFGTECLGYGMLASGFVDLVIEGGLSAYDIMPLIPIVEGAGGIITDWQGNAALKWWIDSCRKQISGCTKKLWNY